jgi:hypothetical protein
MTQDFLHLIERSARIDQQAGKTVPEVMQAHI